ncbi:tetratricopeptide repeat-containing protein [Aulosira sp. FACHB-113]|nr:tetratricopeptide repeat-containing protein [Aulosira sp. FACHB-113]
MYRDALLMYGVTLAMHRVALLMYGVTLAMHRVALLMYGVTLAMHRVALLMRGVTLLMRWLAKIIHDCDRLKFCYGVKIAESLKDSSLQIKALNSLGRTYSQQRQFEAAITYYQQSLNIAQKLENRREEARAFFSASFKCGSIGI